MDRKTSSFTANKDPWPTRLANARERRRWSPASICRNHALLRNKITQSVGTLFPLHGTANRGFIGLLTDSSGNAFAGKMWIALPTQRRAFIRPTPISRMRAHGRVASIRLSPPRNRKVVSYCITTSIKTNHKAHYGRSSNYRSIYPTWRVEVTSKLSYVPIESRVGSTLPTD